MAYKKKLSEIGLDGVTKVDDLYPAEQGLVAAVRIGKPYAPPGFELKTVPEAATDDNRVRPALIRHLLQGGCDDAPIGERGLDAAGLWIDGPLNLRLIRSDHRLGLFHCRMEDGIDLDDAQLYAVNLHGSQIGTLRAQRLILKSNFFAQNTVVTEQVSLMAARIGGQLSCVGAEFKNGLIGQAMQIGSDCLLREGFKAGGLVDLNGSQIGGQLNCGNGHFEARLTGHRMQIGGSCFLRGGFTAKGDVDLTGSAIGGQLNCRDAEMHGIVNFPNVTVGTDFILECKIPPKALSVDNMSCRALWDRPADWPEGMTFNLTGFTYDGFGQTSMRLTDRLRWVACSLDFGSWDEKTEAYRFSPKPYTQLAQVYSREGRRYQANQVLAAREWAIAVSQNNAAYEAHDGTWKPAWRSLIADVKYYFALFAHVFFGSGYNAFRPVGIATGMVLVSWIFFHQSFEAGSILPRSDIVLNSPSWETLDGDVHKWIKTRVGQDYVTFRPALYAFDLLIPLDTLDQEEAWNSAYNRGRYGWIGHRFELILQVSGWLLTAFLAAFLTGLIGRRGERD
ncbi:MAG: hypothetical protein AAFR98_01475 [Pseudomonadota bacterium]